MNNRDNLLANALQLFTDFGYEATGTQEICDLSGVTKPTLYHYFKSKQGLLDTILRDGFKPLMEQLTDAADYQHDLTLNIEKIMRVYFRFAEENGAFYRLQLALRHAPIKSEAYASVLPWMRRQQDLLVETFRKAEPDHGNMRGRADYFALTLLGVINANIVQSLDGNQSLSDELLYRARHQYMHGIFS